MPKSPRFVVYSTVTTMEKARYYHRKPADALAFKLNTSHTRDSSGVYAVATIDDYNNNIVHMVERVNLMSGKKYMEPSNTPNYCSPASEAYWSM